jgi:hypothetical protein
MIRSLKARQRHLQGLGAALKMEEQAVDDRIESLRTEKRRLELAAELYDELAEKLRMKEEEENRLTAEVKGMKNHPSAQYATGSKFSRHSLPKQTPQPYSHPSARSRTGTPFVQTLLPSPNLRYQEREETPLESDDSDFETPARFRTEPVVSTLNQNNVGRTTDAHASSSVIVKQTTPATNLEPSPTIVDIDSQGKENQEPDLWEDETEKDEENVSSMGD